MRNLRLFSGLILAALILGSFATAQVNDNNLSRHYLVDVKSGMQMQFEAAFKAHVQWRKAQGDPWQWSVFQLVNGEHMGDYVIRSGPHSWADFDAYEDFLNRGAGHFWASVGPFVNSVHGYITQSNPSVSRWVDDPTSVRYLTVIDYWIKPTHVPQFQQAIKTIHEAIGTSGWPARYAWEATLNGGPGNNWALILPSSNYAGMKGPEKPMPQMLTEVYGPEKMQELMGQFAESVERSESHIARVRPDLSSMN